MSISRQFGNGFQERDFVWSTTHDPPWDPASVSRIPVTYELGHYRAGRHTNFHARKAAGELLDYLPYERFDSTMQQSGFVSVTHSGDGPPAWSFTDKCNGYDLRDASGEYPNYEVDVVTVQELYSAIEEVKANYPALLQSAASQAWDGFDAGTFLGELKKTLEMLRGIYPRAVKYQRGLRSHKTKRNADVISGAWLEGRYGWRPLIGEIESAVEALQIAKRKIYTGRAGFDTSWSTTRNVLIVKPVYEADMTVREDFTVGSRAMYAALIEADLRGFINPAVTAWELVPFSFVVDWIYNIGKTIAAISSEILSTTSTGSYGMYAKITRHAYVNGATPDPNSDVSEVLLNASFKAVGELRMRQPASVSYSPNLDINLSWSKLLDSFTLAFQIGKRGKTSHIRL